MKRKYSSIPVLLALVPLFLSATWLPAQIQFYPSTNWAFSWEPDYQIDHTWDVGAWDTLRKVDLAFLGPDSLAEAVFYQHGTNGFSANLRRTQTYDTAGQLIEVRNEIYQSSLWVNATSLHMSYDSLGSLVGHVELSWNGSSWDTTLAYRNTWVYNGSGQPQLMQGYAYTGQTPLLEQSYFYGIGGMLDSLHWDLFGTPGYVDERYVVHGWHDYNAWQVDSVDRYRWDANSGTSQLYVTLGCDYSGSWPRAVFSTEHDSQGSAQQSYVREYDQNGLPTYYSLRDATNGNLLDEKVSSYLFDGQGRPTQYLETNLIQGQQVNFQRIDYFYDQFNSTAEAQEVELAVWPNPASEIVRFRWGDEWQGATILTLYDMAGRLRMRQALGADVLESELELSPLLENGNYILRLEGAAGHLETKVVLRR